MIRIFIPVMIFSVMCYLWWVLELPLVPPRLTSPEKVVLISPPIKDPRAIPKGKDRHVELIKHTQINVCWCRRKSL